MLGPLLPRFPKKRINASHTFDVVPIRLRNDRVSQGYKPPSLIFLDYSPLFPKKRSEFFPRIRKHGNPHTNTRTPRVKHDLDFKRFCSNCALFLRKIMLMISVYPSSCRLKLLSLMHTLFAPGVVPYRTPVLSVRNTLRLCENSTTYGTGGQHSTEYGTAAGPYLAQVRPVLVP